MVSVQNRIIRFFFSIVIVFEVWKQSYRPLPSWKIANNRDSLRVGITLTLQKDQLNRLL